LKEYKTSDIRNVVLVGHGGAGKTSLAESLLFAGKGTSRFGKVDEGNSILDYAEDETERKITLNLAVAHLEYKSTKINFIDTPGYADFYGDTKAGVRAGDAALVVVRGDAGVEVGTDKVWEFADEAVIPKLIVINRMDKEHANFDKVLAELQDRYGTSVAPMHIPVGTADDFSGVVDLLTMKYYKYDRSKPAAGLMQDIPGNLGDRAKSMREKLIESIAESSDELLEAYLEGKEIQQDAIVAALQSGFKAGKIVPVFCASAVHAIGAQQILDAIAAFFPSPLDIGVYKCAKPGSSEVMTREISVDKPFAALVFKTISEPHLGDMSIFKVYSGAFKEGTEVFNSVKGSSEKVTQLYSLMGKERKEVNRVVAGDIGATVKLKDTSTNDTLCAKADPVIVDPINFPRPVVREALVPKTKGEEDKVSSGLSRLLQEDPTFTLVVDPEIKQTIISGLGELHLSVILDRLKKRSGVEVELKKPRIPYKETIKGTSEQQGKYKKQTGGRGQYGDVWLRLAPMPRGAGFEFEDAIVGGAVPSKFVPAVEKGVRETMDKGAYAGYNVVDVKTTVYDGSFHPVDSSDMAFKVAASMAFKKAFLESKPVLLEPIMNITVTVPEENLGDVMGDVSSRRGKIQGVDNKGNLQVIRAQVPLAELYKYSTTLRSMTQGRGMYENEFSHYEEVPHEIAQKIVEEHLAAKAEK
jgi:elongation factor G